MTEQSQKKPLKILLEKGKRYAVCSCGKTAKGPFCDGSHKGSEYKPNVIIAEEDKEVYLCGCFSSNNHPYCDGSHKRLEIETKTCCSSVEK